MAAALYLYIDGSTYEEIAELQNISPATARTRVCKVRKLLVDKFPDLVAELRAGRK